MMPLGSLLLDELQVWNSTYQEIDRSVDQASNELAFLSHNSTGRILAQRVANELGDRYEVRVLMVGRPLYGIAPHWETFYSE